MNKNTILCREDLRNIAVIAHVDHGKTTLIDAMLKQTNTFTNHQYVDDRIMDSGELEREKGITILAKNTSILYSGIYANNKEITINVIDTPGHSDFGGEVERGLSMVDGVILLVDASEGPLPQTSFVLKKALSAKLPVILLINKTDRKDANIVNVVKESQDLIINLSEDLINQGIEIDLDAALNVPIVYASAKSGKASMKKPDDSSEPNNKDLEPLFKTILSHIPAPIYDPNEVLQAHVTNLDSSPFLGRLALTRIYQGYIHKGQTVAWARQDGTIKNVKISELLITKGLKRLPVEKAGPGDIIAVAGISNITIGETLTDINQPKPLPLMKVDEPTISVTIGINTSPLAGKKKGSKVTARQIKDRLDRELIGNVSIRVLPTSNPDFWEVRGRGELALAVLIEQMRREGYELTVGKPKVILKEINGQQYEPTEYLTVDVPKIYLGGVTQLLACRKGRMTNMVNHGSDSVRMEFIIPSRGLIGFRNLFLTETHGTGVLNAIAADYEPWQGTIISRNSGSLIADRAGFVTSYALNNLSDRGIFFVYPGQEVYTGMIVGENNRADDMEINIVREKKLTNIRSSTSAELERLTPHKKLSLEESLEFAREDECLEITYENIRLRKLELTSHARKRKIK